MKVLGIAGSIRRGSHNARLLRAAASALPPGVELVTWDGLAGLPAYDPDLDAEATPDAAVELRQAIADADAVLIATPEYNGSLPGGLKNALDWASRPFDTNPLRGKPVAVAGAVTGLFGAVWAQAEARKVLGIIGADVLDRQLAIGQADAAFVPGEDQLADPDLQNALEEHVAALADMVATPTALAA